MTTLLLLAVSCRQSNTPTTQSSSDGEWHEFGGTWTAEGTRRTLPMGDDRLAAVFNLTGSLILSGAQRPAVGFRAEAIGFSDSRTGMEGRCVWTDEDGDKVFSQIKGQLVEGGNHIEGTFIGGTGRWVGITGEYSFQWQYVVDAADGAVSGRVVDLKGRARIAPPATAPGSAEGAGR